MNIKKILSTIFVSAIFIFLLSNIYKNWQTIIDYTWKFDPQNIVLLLLFLVPVYLVNGMSWYLINKSLGANVNYFQSLKVLMFGNFGRFIPGGIWQYAGRIYLAKKEGVDSSLTTVAIFIETIFTLIIGSFLIFYSGFFWQLQIKNLILIPGLIVFAGIVILFFAKKKQLSFNLNFKWTPFLLASLLLQFIVDGSILYFLSQNAVALALDLYPMFITIFAISWTLGFLTFFAPSGLGVQEVTMAVLLSNYMPFAVASVIAISFRAILLVAEIATVSAIIIREKITS